MRFHSAWHRSRCVATSPRRWAVSRFVIVVVITIGLVPAISIFAFRPALNPWTCAGGWSLVRIRISNPYATRSVGTSQYTKLVRL